MPVFKKHFLWFYRPNNDLINKKWLDAYLNSLSMLCDSKNLLELSRSRPIFAYVFIMFKTMFGKQKASQGNVAEDRC